MEYIFGTVRRDGISRESLKTKGAEHSDLKGRLTVERKYSDSIISDTFNVIEKYDSDEDAEGNCYDWYVIDNHFRDTDHYTPAKEALLGKIDYMAMMTGIDLDEGEEEEFVLREDE